MRGLYRVAGRPACMTDPEYALWRDMNEAYPRVAVKSPCSDCPAEWAAAMRRHDQCDGTPMLGVMGRPREDDEPVFMIGRGRHAYATEEERIAARRASWRASGARKRAAAAGAVA